MAQHKGTALITGASAGLGERFAALFAADGQDVALVARRRERLDEIAAALREKHGVKAHVLPADLGDPKAPERLFAAAREQGLEVSHLVNNAGFGSSGPFLDQELEREAGMIEVNISALVRLTHLFAKPMLERGFGRVLNLASTAGFQPGPYMATYYASKAFVISFSEALAHELRGTGVRVTCHCPGATATEFALVAGNDKSKLFKARVASPDDIVRHAYAAMHKGTLLAIPGLMNKVQVQGLRMTPRFVTRSLAGWLNGPA